jgi:hypothetical protein
MHGRSTITHRISVIFFAVVVCCSTPLDSSTAPPHGTGSTTKITRSLSSLPRAVLESAGFHTKQWGRGWENIEATPREYGEEIILDRIGGGEEGERACIIWLHGQASCGQDLAQTLGMAYSGAIVHARACVTHHYKHFNADFMSVSVCLRAHV